MRRRLQVCLVEPRIPPNTGNIARLCAALKIPLHLIEPLGFEIDDKAVKRAGLDYWPLVDLHLHSDLDRFLRPHPQKELFFFSTRGPVSFWDARFGADAILIFGNETAGLAGTWHERYPERFFRIPQLESGVRSLNLSSAVAIAVYEALRQIRRQG